MIQAKCDWQVDAPTQRAFDKKKKSFVTEKEYSQTIHIITLYV